MKEVKINQCDFCTKTSFNKGSLKIHEKKCFYNPITRSCATCLWFSQKHLSGSPTICFAREKYASVNEYKSILKTNCIKWISVELIEDIDISENEGRIFDHLLAGDLKVLNIIEGIKTDGSSYYNGKTSLVTG